MSPIDIEIAELIDDLAHYSNSIKEQKDNAIKNSGSFRSVGILYTIKEIKAIVESLNKKFGKDQ